MDLAAVAEGLTEREPGLWVVDDEPQLGLDVSYPASGHGFIHDLEADSFWFRHRTACILAALDRHPPAGAVFDVGGGTGHLTAALVAAGREAVLVEPGEEGARLAWERGVRPVVRATTSTAGFRDRSLPAVGLFDVVEHVEDDDAFLDHVHDLLVADGRVYITVPAHQWLWSVDDVRAGHHRRYTEASMRALLDRTGFTVEYLTAFFRPLPVPVLAVRAIPSRLGWRDVEDRSAGARDHRSASGGIAGRLLDRLLAPEVGVIARGRSMRFGSSLLVVARRTEAAAGDPGA